MKLFHKPECVKGNVINGHAFDENGTLLVSDEDAERLSLVLVRYYGCTVEDVPTTDGEFSAGGEGDPSLVASNTRNGQPPEGTTAVDGAPEGGSTDGTQE